MKKQSIDVFAINPTKEIPIVGKDPLYFKPVVGENTLYFKPEKKWKAFRSDKKPNDIWKKII
jgi:hypothetical protein